MTETRSQLKSSIDTQLPDASAVQIAALRGELKDMVDTNAPVQDITTLRNISGSAGHVVPVGGDTGGLFVNKASDPFGNGDDGAVVLQASDGSWWVRDIGERVDARSFGVAPDGIDRTNELQNAVSFCEGENYSLQLPPGTIRLDGSVTAGKSISIEGHGTQNGTKIDARATDAPALELNTDRAVLRNFFVDADNMGGTADGIRTTEPRVYMENVRVWSAPRYGLKLEKIWQSLFQYCQIAFCQTGINLQTSGGGSDVTFAGTRSVQNTNYGLHLDSAGSGVPRARILGGDYSSNDIGIFADGIIEETYIVRSHHEANATAAIDLATPRGCTIAPATTRAPTGVILRQARDCTVRGGSRHDNSNATLQLGDSSTGAQRTLVIGHIRNSGGGTILSLKDTFQCRWVHSGGEFPLGDLQTQNVSNGSKAYDQGEATITSGTTTTSVSYNTWRQPNPENITVTPKSSYVGSAATQYAVTNIGSGNFDIVVDQDPAQDISFGWSVDLSSLGQV